VTVTTADHATAPPRPRSALRSVALPSEHGGWGLTIEPALLGLLVAPGFAGLLLAVAAVLAFLARTPLKIVLVDVRRHRRHERTDAAAMVLLVETVVLLSLFVGALATGAAGWWWPAIVAAPLVLVELWFDMRSRSRRLLPELAGSIGIGAAAAMVVLADGGRVDLALGLWLVVGGRALTSIPAVRAMVARIHGRAAPAWTVAAGDVAALLAVGTAALLDARLAAGGVAVATIVVVQRAIAGRPLPPAKVLGLRQLAMGLALVVVTAAGVHLG
jgi:hypothetical protein